MIDIQKNFSMFQILDENGNANEKLMPQLRPEEIRKMYELMILTRVFDETALKLQREGRILTYASCRGQEASQIGSAIVLNKDDWLFPSFREHGAQLLRGFPPELLYLYWGGDERGMNIQNNESFTVSIPVGTQLLHAVGAAWAFKLRNEKKVSMVYFGDGATSEGDFHEAMNFAGVFKVPCIFVCQNNQWAISVPRKRQTASETLAQKAVAYGFDGIKVDGNDIFAVFKVAKEAIEKARAGGGPTFIECYTYRMSDHTTADDASKYRDAREVEEWKKKDPVERLEKYMMRKKMLDEKLKQKILDEATKKIEETVKRAEAIAPQDPTEMFHYTFAEMLWNQKEQLDELHLLSRKKVEVAVHE